MLANLHNLPDEAALQSKAELLYQCDTLADAVIDSVYFPMGFVAANVLVDSALQAEEITVAQIPEALQALLAAVREVPAWLDRELLHVGGALCRRAGSLGLIVLRNYCLMGGYESSAINKPLIYTGALKKGASKRMAETIEFWVNATAKGGLEQGAEGFRMAVRVRLMHAFARRSILRQTDWDSDAWGLPINAWDMVATNLGFSMAFLDGLRNLGFRPTPREVEGLLHFWKYIGHLIGIPVAELPDTEPNAIRALYAWTITQPPADADTVALAQALMREPYDTFFPKRMWQKKLLIQAHIAYNHFLLGERSCSAIGLPAPRMRVYPYFVRFVNRSKEGLVQVLPPFRRLSERIGRAAQVKIMREFLHGHRSALAARQLAEASQASVPH